MVISDYIITPKASIVAKMNILNIFILIYSLRPDLNRPETTPTLSTSKWFLNILVNLALSDKIGNQGLC